MDSTNNSSQMERLRRISGDDSLTADTSIVNSSEAPPPYELLTSQLVEDAVDVTDDGRIEVDANSKLARVLSRFIPDPPNFSQLEPQESPTYSKTTPWTVKLNIVIQVVGSRGDVQPFIALGNELQNHGHRVRLATHNVFESFVLASNLEFYPIGGNPEELMAFMVKNPGLIPSMKSLRQGDVQQKRVMVEEILHGCWDSCLEPDPVSRAPFVADAIIANPPSFAHVHCAQALAIPVHIMFTMPWSNTRAFPHPLANLKNVGKDPTIANYISYSVVEWLTWQGLGDVINKFRRSLDLESLSAVDGPNLANALNIPFTYCWSPALVPKPDDWPARIDLCGFFFREPPNYNPPPDLAAFLSAGPPPVYIGFGSIVIEDPAKMGALLIEAVRKCGVRAIISRGWSKIGGPDSNDILYLGDCPHEWLFQKVAAVVHHGGAGTTACGLLNGRPTVVIPFFGDQQFWGSRVAVAGAGPKPIHHKLLTAENLAEAISFCLTPPAAIAAKELAAKMSTESGVKAAVNSFHRHLPIEKLKCDILRDQPPVWTYRRKNKTLKLSKIAAELLSDHLKIDHKQLELYEVSPIVIETHRFEPVSSTTHAFVATYGDLLDSTAGIIYKPYQEYRSAYNKRRPSIKMTGASDSGSLGTASDAASTISAKSLESRPKVHRVAGAMAGASAKSLGMFWVKGVRGLAVDIPLATTEGLKNVPALYGEKVRNNGQVTDWKSGAIVGGKSFYYGMTEGLTDIFTQPYHGAKEEGAIGAVKGVGKGTVALMTKTGSALLGTFAYPAQGIAKSIRTAVNFRTRKQIMKARRVEGQYMLESAHEGKIDQGRMLAMFDALMKSQEAEEGAEEVSLWRKHTSRSN